mmetsp:Transcript_38824/g.81470  ORF Transcript_38824/g.81470 Transcript_38824/m.81470 type:complete len:358 (-) Transcript_38824:270-1343(-)
MIDGLDLLLQEAEQSKAERNEAARRRDKEARASAVRALQREQLQSSALKLAADAASSTRAKKYSRKLRSFLELLLEAPSLESLQTDLQKHSYADFEAYYGSKPELSTYTIDCELKRMEYCVKLPDGSSLLSASDIKHFYLSQNARSSAEELVWRAANQSLFADVLAAVQVCWMDPSLSIAVSASRCAFELDLGGAAPSLRAECTLAVQTLGHGEAPLQLAECIATVELSPQRRVRRQWVDKPRLCDCVVFEESMLAVAATLANYSAIEGAAAGGGGDGGGGGGVSGGASGSGGSCAERRRDELLTPATHNDAPDPCQSLEEVTKQLEHFMSDEKEEAEPSYASSRGRSLLSGLFSAW